VVTALGKDHVFAAKFLDLGLIKVNVGCVLSSDNTLGLKDEDVVKGLLG